MRSVALRMDENIEFYPSHLTKGLVAGFISLGFGIISMGFGALAVREFSLIGTDVYPDPPPPPRPPMPPELSS